MKRRPEIPKETVTELMLLCAHRCCLDREEFSVINPLDIHHLDANPENNALDNLMPVCKNCHLARIHVKIPFGRSYTESELKAIRDEWYQLVREQKTATASIAVKEQRLDLQDETEPTDSLEFVALFESQEVLLGTKTKVIFRLKNNTQFTLRLLSYQFQIYYRVLNKHVHHVTFQKHYWNLDPKKLAPEQFAQIEFGEVDPLKYYFLSNQRGEWIAQIILEFSHNDKSIGSVFSSARLRVL
jgi:hypothetical protein